MILFELNVSSIIDRFIQQAIRDGSKVIFTTSPRMLQESLRAAVEYPDITVKKPICWQCLYGSGASTMSRY